MPRPRFFRDPVHGQIRFDRHDLSQAPDGTDLENQICWLIPTLINTKPFQRLRHIRQNGLSNYVFYGLEHSRFTHSIGVYHVGAQMYDSLTRNSLPETPDTQRKLCTVIACLLHDIGHGPFSHSLEEIVRQTGKSFDHETITKRFILEPGEINEALVQIDKNTPQLVAQYIDKSLRTKDHWSFRIVSSQFDADRIDYMLRDSQLAGFTGQGFDLSRLLDLIYVENNRVVIDRHATEALESYLLTLMHLYIAIYYHRGVRGATVLLLSVLKRAFDLHQLGDSTIFPDKIIASTGEKSRHPLVELLEEGDDVSLTSYQELTEFTVWSLISDWQQSKDSILSDLSNRLLSRRTFRSKEIDYHGNINIVEIASQIPAIISKKLTISEEDARRYYFREDKPDRTGYSAYNWDKDQGDDKSIWVGSHDGSPQPIEQDTKNEIFKALRAKRVFPRFMYPREVEQDIAELL